MLIIPSRLPGRHALYAVEKFPHYLHTLRLFFMNGMAIAAKENNCGVRQCRMRPVMLKIKFAR
jgi:hypothetical protein